MADTGGYVWQDGKLLSLQIKFHGGVVGPRWKFEYEPAVYAGKSNLNLFTLFISAGMSFESFTYFGKAPECLITSASKIDGYTGEVIGITRMRYEENSNGNIKVYAQRNQTGLDPEPEYLLYTIDYQ